MNRTRPVALLLGVLLVAATSLGPRTAAADKGQKRFGVQAGFAGLSSEGSFAGYGGGLTFGYGVTDAWTLRLDGTASSNQATDKGGRSLVLGQSIGFQYALDVIELVPFFGVYASLYELRGGGLAGTQLKPAISLGVGLDWLASRSFSFGIDVRVHALPADFVGSPTNPTPFYQTTLAKAEYNWGWF
jgi:hypothetical protein